MKIETRESTMEKAAAMMGIDQPSALDFVERDKFPDDESYLDAATKAAMERSSPEYQQTRRKLAGELRERKEAAQKAELDAAYKEIRATVQLDDVDKREIDAQAARLARQELAQGKIAASGLGVAIADHADKLTAARKDSRAAAQLFNSMLRRK